MNNSMPIPRGNYVPAKHLGDMVYTFGMALRQIGKLKVIGQVSENANIEDYRVAVELACGNVLNAARGQVQDGECIDQIVSLSVFIAVEPDFTEHAKLADFASNFLFSELGDRGI